MSNAIATRETATVSHNGPASDLAITEGQTFWTPKQKAALVQLGIGNANDADLAVFFHQCARTGLDPFARQIYMIERWTKNGPKPTIQTGIDGFRLIARRATDQRHGTFGYEPTLWCGADGKWVDVWLAAGPPAASKVTVFRDGSTFPAVALYREYVGKLKNGDPSHMWRDKGSLMLAKCAEALALRKAFPQDLSGLYTADEMDSAEPAAQATSPMQRLRQVTEPEPVDTETGEILEGEIEPTPEPITDAQVRKLNTVAGKLGLDREQKISGLRMVTGRDVESSKDLTKAEAMAAIDSLEEALAGKLAQAELGAEEVS